MIGPGTQAALRPAPRLTMAVGRTLALLALSPTDLVRRLVVAAAANPALRLVPPPAPAGRPAFLFGALSPALDPAELASPGDSLIAHVLRQITAMGLSPRDRAIALVLTEALEPTGWLGSSTDRLARVCGVPEPAVLDVLARLHRIEPGGLFARSLSECLRLQALQAGEMTPELSLVLEHLPLLADGGAAALEAETGLPSAQIGRALRQIRSYDPKPGLAFAVPAPPLPPADLLLQPDGAMWTALPNPNTFALEVDPDHPGRADAEALRRAVEGRLRIALILGVSLARRQTDWLNGGLMAAVTARSLAEETGLHVSTVNRCLAGVTARTPLGTKPLRALVSHAVDGADTSGMALRQRLRALIAEAAPRPVTDAALTAQLAQEGIIVARRTVAKYRLALTQSLSRNSEMARPGRRSGG